MVEHLKKVSRPPLYKEIPEFMPYKLYVFSAALRSLPPGHHVAGAGVLFWDQVHAGRLFQFREVGVRLHIQSFGGYPLFTAGGCGHCSLGSQFSSWEGESVDVFIVLFLSNQLSFQVWWPLT